MTLRNVAEVLEFAMLYNASQLRDVCTELLTNNLATVIESRFVMFKGAVSRNCAKLGNYKMPVKLRET